MATPQRTGPSFASGGTRKLTSWNPFENATTPGPANSHHDSQQGGAKGSGSPYYVSKAPSINAPVGGGALRSIEDKFQVNPATGTSSLSVPFAVPPGRGGIGPSVTLSYNSGSGNSPFGLGWSLALPSISRKTSQGIPQYDDSDEGDVFLFTGVEDLVPKTSGPGKGPEGVSWVERRIDDWTIREYWPRTEGAYSRIERWFKPRDTSATHWRTISGDNVVSFYGQDSQSRIMDPSTGRIFAWLLCSTYDVFGNAVEYQYKAEDSEGIRPGQANEVHRTDATRARNRYIKSIRYGNAKPAAPSARRGGGPQLVSSTTSGKSPWMFEVVFDYGDHQSEMPTARPDRAWPARRDAFSVYNSGFEVRTYRLCRRLLLFHHFPDELGVEDYLVQSMELVHDESEFVSVLSSVVQSAHAMQTTKSPREAISRSLPPLKFEYSMVDLSSASIKTAPPLALQNLPAGLSPPLQWLDLDGVGKASPLVVGETGWFRMRNLSSCTADYHVETTAATTGQVMFGPAEMLPAIPATAVAGDVSLLDVGGSGRLDVVQSDVGRHGFYERTDEGGWTEFTRFPKWPTVNLENPNLRYLDLTGNGLADIVIAEADSFVWYPALGTDGYGDAIRTATAASEQEGARILFADGLESIHLADFSGDGLADLVRIRNGDICYWPNLGYGRFGAKVAMDNAPWMAPHDMFNQERLQLADIDGSGVADILYFPPEGGLRVYMNLCGNSWASPIDLLFPLLDSLSHVSIVDMFGLGLSSVVWSTSLPSSPAASLQYLDFTRGRKPHLLMSSSNGPIETRLQYTSSTTLREADEQNGRHWAARLPFPVQCLTQSRTYDRLSQVYTETSYRYRDGYYDGLEREFHGFGMAETIKREHVLLGRASSAGFPSPAEINGMAHKLSSATSKTVSWFHLGGREAAEAARKMQENEFYHEPGVLDLDLFVSLRQVSLPPEMTPLETRQAWRTLKGTPLRSEVYQPDGSGKQYIPFSISDNTTGLRMLQRAIGNKHPAVFLTLPGESLALQLERNNTDPRISHTLPLEVDDWGNVTKSAAVAYGRKPGHRTAMHSDEDWKAQSSTLVTYSENYFTAHHISMENDYRIPLSYEHRVFEVKGLETPLGGALLTMQELSPAAIQGLKTKRYTDLSDSPGRRLLSRQHTRFRANDLSRMLGPSELESRAIPGESYTLAMTPDIVELAFHAADTTSLLSDPSILGGKGESDGGYVDLEADGSWWIPSGQARFLARPDATPAQELEAAETSFFQPARFIDPFGNAASIEYDRYFSFVVSATDAVGNNSGASIDYRTLQPYRATDQNGNETFAAFDVFGQCVGIAVGGKPTPGHGSGDTLEGFQPNIKPETVLGLLSNPKALSTLVLARCTSASFSYHATPVPGDKKDGGGEGAWNPGFSVAIARTTHENKLQEGSRTPVQASVTYLDGRGQPLQTRTLSSEVPGPEQWIVSGVSITNSGGAVLRSYDAVFASSPAFCSLPPDTVFSSSFYDSAGRCIATVLPNRTWAKTVHGAWTQLSYDPGDTVLVEDPTLDPDVGTYLSADAGLVKPTWYSSMTQPSASALDRRIAQSCEAHANRPTEMWLDVMGAAMLSVVDAGGEEGKHISRCYTDRQGRVRKAVDAEGRLVGVSDFDMVGTCVHAVSMDTGESWVINDVAGSPIRTCNGRQVQVRTCYDVLRRPVRIMTRAGLGEASSEFTAQVLVYGEGQADAEEQNLRGKLYECRDQGCVTRTLEYDHLGNALRASQQLVREYKGIVDWGEEVPFEGTARTWLETFDALGRSLAKTRSDGSVVTSIWAINGSLVGLRSSSGDKGPAREGDVIRGIEYNARGQRLNVQFGNGAECRYSYHPTSFWMTSKVVTAPSSHSVGGGRVVLHLQYSYDCMGRIVRIEDAAQQDVFFRGEVIKPVQEFAYDAIGRLQKASGREHIGQARQNWKAIPSAVSAAAREASPSDGKAMANYVETYRYSSEGNILSIAHTTSDPKAPGWTRTFRYQEPSLVEEGKHNNRLSSMSVGNEVSMYKYEGLAGAMGLITSMSGFPLLQYDLSNHLCASSTQQQSDTAAAGGDTPETTWYRYDSSNQRVRKTSERAARAVQEPVRRSKDHFYFKDGIDVFRKWRGPASNPVVLSERWTWRTFDDEGCILSTEANLKSPGTDTDGDGSWSDIVSLWAVADHTSSVTLELDDSAAVVSREEFSPYGSTTYDGSAHLELDKRYRYAGKERDLETGLYYFENRYLVPWLGRWLSPDPLGTADGPNVYCYVGCDPINHTDPTGLMFRTTKLASKFRSSGSQGGRGKRGFSSTSHLNLPGVPPKSIITINVGFDIATGKQRASGGVVVPIDGARHKVELGYNIDVNQLGFVQKIDEATRQPQFDIFGSGNHPLHANAALAKLSSLTSIHQLWYAAFSQKMGGKGPTVHSEPQIYQGGLNFYTNPDVSNPDVILNFLAQTNPSCGWNDYESSKGQYAVSCMDLIIKMFGRPPGENDWTIIAALQALDGRRVSCGGDYPLTSMLSGVPIAGIRANFLGGFKPELLEAYALSIGLSRKEALMYVDAILIGRNMFCKENTDDARARFQIVDKAYAQIPKEEPKPPNKR